MKTPLKLLVVLGVLAGIGWMFHSMNLPPKDRSVRVQALSPPAETIEGLGYVEPVSELRRLTSKVNGIVRRCVATEGQQLKEGDVILELDSDVEERTLDVARAKLALANSRLAELDSGVNPHRIRVAERMLERLAEAHRHAVSDFEREELVSARQASTAAELDRFRTQRDQAKISLHEQEAELAHLRNYVTPEIRSVALAKVGLAQTEVTQAEVAVQNTRITAPCTGQVLRYLKHGGDGCSTFLNEPAALFADTSRLRVRVEFDEQFVDRLHVGLKAEVYGPTLGGKTIVGHLTRVEALMGNKTVFTLSAAERKDIHVVEAVIDLPTDFSARIGLRVDVRIKLTPEPAN